MSYTLSRCGVRFSPDAVLHLWEAWRQFRVVGDKLVVTPQADWRRFAYGGDPSPWAQAVVDDLSGHEFFWYVGRVEYPDFPNMTLCVSSDGIWLERAD